MKYETQPGQHIKNACEEAILLAIKHQCEVEFKFNGVHLTATKDKLSHLLENEFEIKLKENQEKYLQSDEYKAFQRKQKEELINRQEVIDQLMTSFKIYIKSNDLDNIMYWLKQFTYNADYIGVTYNKKYISDFFELNGFKENEYVGQSKEFFNNKENIALYIIGQVINFLRNDMPPHPITLKFIDDYFSLES